MGLRRLVVKPSADPVEWAWLREQLHRLLGEPAVPAAPVASNAESRLNAVDPAAVFGRADRKPSWAPGAVGPDRRLERRDTSTTDDVAGGGYGAPRPRHKDVGPNATDDGYPPNE